MDAEWTKKMLKDKDPKKYKELLGRFDKKKSLWAKVVSLVTGR